MALLRQRPHYASAFSGWEAKNGWDMQLLAVSENPPPVFKEALEFTSFALDEFKRRADSDGVHLVILAVHHNGDSRNPFQVTLNDLATPKGIPVLSQHDYILRSDGAIEDANSYDGHWNPSGHLWAAEVLLDYLKQNPELCLSRRRRSALLTARQPFTYYAGVNTPLKASAFNNRNDDAETVSDNERPS